MVQMHPALPALVRRLAAQPIVESVCLFGSRARGDAAPRSDIDLAVAAPQASVKDWQAILDAVAQAETLLPIDLIRLDEASEELRARIASEGIVLYDRSKGHAEPA